MSLLGKLALLFVVVPLAELVLLVQMGRWVGLVPTLALVVLTGMAGAWLARLEGTRTLWSFRAQVAHGSVPGHAVMDGLCILVGGALLLTPGILTDVVGFSLLVPPTRRWIQKRIRQRLEAAMAEGTLQVTQIRFGDHPDGHPSWPFGAPRGGADDPSEVIDAEVVEVIDGDGEPSPGRPDDSRTGH